MCAVKAKKGTSQGIPGLPTCLVYKLEANERLCLKTRGMCLLANNTQS